MWARLAPRVMASNFSHTFTHLPQPMQLTLHSLVARAPLSLLLQRTTTLRFLGPWGTSSIMPRGQVLAQAPQPVHLLSSTSAMRVAGFTVMAPNRHTLAQSPSPRQPYWHWVSPIPVMFCTLHEWAPSNSTPWGRTSHVPWQRTTATLGAAADACRPSMPAICSITAWPPGAQFNSLRLPPSAALTHAEAKPEQPG